nr:aminoglycoside phosphotransferase family protein [Ruegeria arenilitoris]
MGHHKTSRNVVTDPRDEFLAKWQLTFPVLVAETDQAQVWRVVQADGRFAALKLYRRSDRGNETHGSSLLRLWQSRGAVRIVQDEKSAVLMDWLDGPSLGDLARAGRPDAALAVLAKIAGRLHHAPVVKDAELKPLHEVFDPMFSCQFSLNCPSDFRRDMVRAMHLARTLLTSQPIATALHGDLHPDNVILTDDGPRVFDAKGYLGDPAFELANALRHPKGMVELVRQRSQIERCLTLYSSAMNVSSERLAQWAAAKCALSIFWRADGQIKHDNEADLLHLLLEIVNQ